MSQYSDIERAREIFQCVDGMPICEAQELLRTCADGLLNFPFSAVFREPDDEPYEGDEEDSPKGWGEEPDWDEPEEDEEDQEEEDCPEDEDGLEELEYRLRAEREDLDHWHDTLSAEITALQSGEGYEGIKEDFDLLIQQLGIINRYRKVLDKRLANVCPYDPGV